jgi:hypothetical protein
LWFDATREGLLTPDLKIDAWDWLASVHIDQLNVKMERYSKLSIHNV